MGWNDHSSYGQHFASAIAHEIEEGGLGELLESLDVISLHTDHAKVSCPQCGRSDARVFLDKVPSLYCFSEGCADGNRSVNADLATLAREQNYKGAREPTPDELEEIEFRRRLWRIKKHYRSMVRPRLLGMQPIPLSKWTKCSTFPVLDYVDEVHWRLLLAGLFPKDGYIWVGEEWDVGEAAFRHRDDWLQRQTPWGAQVSTCTFEEGRLYSGGRYRHEFKLRSHKNIRDRLYVVLESDNTPADRFGQIALWGLDLLRTIDPGVQMRAIIHTGTLDQGRSPHFWFDRPRVSTPESKRQTRESRVAHWKAWHRNEARVYAMLAGVGCDAQMLRHNAMTARLPGVPRIGRDGEPTGCWQKLLFLDPRFPISKSTINVISP